MLGKKKLVNLLFGFGKSCFGKNWIVKVMFVCILICKEREEIIYWSGKIMSKNDEIVKTILLYQPIHV